MRHSQNGGGWGSTSGQSRGVKGLKHPSKRGGNVSGRLVTNQKARVVYEIGNERVDSEYDSSWL